MGKTKEDRIKTVFGGGGHVVILGAGASIAATHKNRESTGKALPSMDNFIEIVGLRDIVDKLPDSLRATNFEKLYSNLYNNNPDANEIKEIEERVQEYFKDMTLPDEPTIYDYLVLSLRSKDIIATFNWDPFLFQAWNRNNHIGENPYIAFLHGNVALGYSEIDKRSGPAGLWSKATRNYYTPTKLLYPVTKKNYNDDPFIKTQWDMLDSFLSDDHVVRVTVFGYGAPETDVEAIDLLRNSWGGGEKRNMEQFEIINTKPEHEIINTWKGFINSHHYDYSSDYFTSSLAYNPRRTSESYFQHTLPQTIDEAFSESNPVPKDLSTLEDLWEWHRPLIDAEEEWKRNNSKPK